MAFLITHFYEGGTAGQYEAVVDAVHPPGGLPAGQVYHAAGPTAAVAVTALAGAGAAFVWWKRHRPTEPLERSTPLGRVAGVARRRAPSWPPWLPGR